MSLALVDIQPTENPKITEITVLKDFEGMTYREVARTLFPNAPVISNNLTGTVRVLFSDEVWNSPYKAESEDKE